MKLTVSFGNPFTATVYTAALLFIGFALGVGDLPGHHFSTPA